ncbi:MAG: DUF456 domain-containing protein [Bacteroidales bacterium]|nr:DUF456 domain-containing protein [Bacteroidales bacterium]
MSTTLVIIATICLLAGIAGSLIPALPGPPLSWLGLLLLNLSGATHFSRTLIVIAALVAIFITLIDNILPSLGTKRRGGSRAGIWGCNIGLILALLGLPFGPQGLLGVIFWPFVGALVGEYLSQHSIRPALSAAWGAFSGFLCGTLAKLAYCVAVAIVAAKELFF